MKTTIKLFLSLALGSFLLIGCGGGSGEGARQDEDHAALARLFHRQINRLTDPRTNGDRYDIDLIRAWTKQTGYAVYYDNYSDEYVAVNLRYYVGSGTDAGRYYRTRTVSDLVQSRGTFRINFYHKETYRDGYGWKYSVIDQYHTYDNIYTDPDTGRQFSDFTDNYNYNTALAESFSEKDRVEKLYNLLNSDYGISETKAMEMASLAVEFANLDPKSIDREITDSYLSKITGLTTEQINRAGNYEDVVSLSQQAAGSMGISTQQVLNLMGLFLFQ